MGDGTATLTAEQARRELRQSVCDDFGQLEISREEWDEFILGVGGDLFSTYDWCSVWWRHFGGRRVLEIYVFRHEERVVAILPLFRETLRLGPVSIRAIRIVGCDHAAMTCSLPIDPSWVAQVVRQFLANAAARGPWDLIHLGPFPGYSDCVSKLFDVLEECDDLRVKRGQEYPQMVFDLPSDYESYVKDLPVKERRNVRRDERRLEKDGTVVRRSVVSQEEVGPAFEQFLDMHQVYWMKCGKLGHFGDWPGSEAFHRDMAECQFTSGRLMLLQVLLNGELVASDYCYECGNCIHWILSGRRPKVPGRIGFCTLVRKAAANGVRQIDAMRGFYEYKRLLGARVTQQTSIVAVRRGLMHRARAGAFRVAARLLDLAYYRIWFCRVAPRLPSLQRPLWQTWIRTRV